MILQHLKQNSKNKVKQNVDNFMTTRKIVLNGCDIFEA